MINVAIFFFILSESIHEWMDKTLSFFFAFFFFKV